MVDRPKFLDSLELDDQRCVDDEIKSGLSNDDAPIENGNPYLPLEADAAMGQLYRECCFIDALEVAGP
jgi:hypothetical protein